MRVDDRALNVLGVLAAIVRSASFAVAGKSSQSGVSRAIARLEARLGMRLLERTTRTITLSKEGRRLYEQIIPLLAGLEEAAASQPLKTPFGGPCGSILTRSFHSSSSGHC
jgi:DNA-binding transcriptional LysR family regulator